MKRLTFLLLLMLTSAAVFAQSTSSVDMADKFRSSGKIYVVIAIMCIIFAGLAIFLFSMDRRLKKIEKGN
jgi:CcmD family protein